MRDYHLLAYGIQYMFRRRVVVTATANARWFESMPPKDEERQQVPARNHTATGVPWGEDSGSIRETVLRTNMNIPAPGL